MLSTVVLSNENQTCRGGEVSISTGEGGMSRPFISKSYRIVKNTFLIGCRLSLSIEINQLFTLWRATDIDDLIANTVGVLVGYFCFKIIHKLKNIEKCIIITKDGATTKILAQTVSHSNKSST